MKLTTLRSSTISINATTPKGKKIDRSISFVLESCRIFFNAQHLLLQLDRGQRAFFDFLCEHMDSANSIVIDSEIRDKFATNLLRYTSGKVKFTASSATQYVVKLAKLGLILKEGGGNSGYYLVNPKYAFAGSESARKELLKTIIEEKIAAGHALLHLIHTTEDDFLGS